MSPTAPGGRRVYVTGGSGFLGSNVVAALAAHPGVELVVSGDLRPPRHPIAGVVVEHGDVTEDGTIAARFAHHRIDTVVHLASIVNPGASTTVEQEYAVDVAGSRHVLDACVEAGVRRLVVSSSGAAYGYHADNPVPLRETDALRGNDTFPYSRHKRLVEEMLAEARVSHPELEQVIFRIGTILGPTVGNQITALWEADRPLEIRGAASPFVFAWVDDVVGAMVHAVADGGPAGAYNVAGDGVVTVREIAAAMGKRTRRVPAWLLSVGLRIGHAMRMTVHGPEQLAFLRYRPVLANDALKDVFGYVPARTSREALDAYLVARAERLAAPA
ncbi:NAD-dependent epimerase/dehydratase family protein [Agromyces sp. SYSU T00194]|uniref:NAD-dependent epimerase/dehydratase family protein n=1 Tax=Agromyces chitinivorans TaxID=3158560 RepID=UPI0033955AD6